MNDIIINNSFEEKGTRQGETHSKGFTVCYLPNHKEILIQEYLPWKTINDIKITNEE